MKKQTKWMIALTAVISSAVLCCNALTLVSPESSEEIDVGSAEVTTALAESADANWQPGLGILSGTTEGFDIDTMNDFGEVLGKYNADSFTIVENPNKNGNDSEKVISANASWNYIYNVKEFSPRLEIERPVSVIYDMYSSHDDNTFVLVNSTEGSDVVIAWHPYQAGEWRHIEKTFITKEHSDAVNGSCAKNGGVKSIHIGFTQTNAGAPTYIDNLDFIPYYKITYLDKNDRVIATDYVLYDADGNFLTSYTPNKALLPNSDSAVTISTEKGGANVDSVPLNNEDIVLYVTGVKAPTTWQPGLGILTGTTAGYDIDTMNDFGEVVGKHNPDSWTIVDNPHKTGNTSEKVLSANAAWNGLYNAKELSPRLEIERPVSVICDVYSSSYDGGLCTLVNGTEGTDVVLWWLSHPAGEWRHIQNTFVTKDHPDAVNGSCAKNGGVAKIYISFGNTPAYVDNLEFIPYYKITYLNENDEVIATDWALYDAAGNVLTAYTPNTAIIPNADAIAAISSEKGGANVDSVALANEDITLYVSYNDLSPKKTDEYSIRLGAIRGMRMTAFVSALQRGVADEYGFIVAIADSFDGDYSALVFPDNMKGATALAEGETGKGTLGTGTKFVYATAYDKESGTDIHKVGSFGDEDGFLINAVMVNISEKNYRTNFVARPYLRVGDSYFYGDAMVKSIYDVANALAQDDAYMDSLSDEDWEYINAIIGA